MWTTQEHVSPFKMKQADFFSFVLLVGWGITGDLI